MGRIRCYFLQNDQQTLKDDAGEEERLTYNRLTCILRIGDSPRIFEGLVDTGCAFSVIPESIWSHFSHAIRWLRLPKSVLVPSHWTDVTGLTGGRFSVDWGELPLVLCDFDGQQSETISVVAKFVHDGGKLPRRLLLGFGKSVFQAGPFHLNVNQQEAWIDCI